MLIVNRYPTQHFPFNKFFSSKADGQCIATDGQFNFIASPTQTEYISSLAIKFIKYVLPFWNNEKFLLNTNITLRISKPNEAFIGPISFVKDDAHVIIPLTSIFGSNSLLVENPPFSNCIKVLTADPGEFILTDNMLIDDNKIVNTTGFTSVCLILGIIRANKYPNGIEGYVAI